MDLIFIDTFIKNVGISLCTYLSFFYIINYKNISYSRKFLIFISVILFAIFYSIIHTYISTSICTLLSICIYSIMLSFISRNKLLYSAIITTISISISYIAFIISSFIVILPMKFFKTIIDETHPIAFILFILIQFILVILLFKIKRFKNGFTFLQNKLSNSTFNIFILTISTLVIVIYLLLGSFYDTSTGKLIILFFIFSLVLNITIKNLFTLYQKQKLLEKTLKEYEAEIKEKDAKLEQLLKEENKLTKANHEFYHRQEALKYKLINLQNTSKENFNEEYGELIDKIDALSKEYKDSIENSKILQKLPKTNIVEIDDMFSYLQHECQKNDIEFTLKINGNIHSIINHIIPKNKLETLIGDLIRNSIIAINYSSKEYRSIMAILGVKENIYELCIYDSGIEFKINTLQKLGIERATTHKESGGTGIGFITTFETLNYCNASLIIHELEPNFNNYSKSITVRFDGKHQYIIDTYRFSEMNNINIYRNDIIIRKSK